MAIARRHTVQKDITYRAVCDLANHPTAEQIYAHVREKHPSISLGTVYRNLASLCLDGMLLHIQLPDAADRYDHNVFSHSHITCTECGEVCDINLEYSTQTDADAEKQTDYVKVSHLTVFRGICPKCQNNLNPKE